MDVKKIGRIPAVRLARPRPDDSTDRVNGQDTTTSIHWLTLSEILPEEKGICCAVFLERAIAWLRRTRLHPDERLMTDNAWAYRHSLRTVCAEHGIVQKFIKLHCPWQNGKVERLNRTLAAEWVYRQAFITNDQRVAALAPWLEHYHTRRRHSALGGLPPISRL